MKDELYFMAGYYIRENADWHSYYHLPIGHKVIVEGHEIELIHVDKAARDADVDFGYYGQSDEVSVTFRFSSAEGDNRFYRKFGYMDSYGALRMRGDFVEVQAVPKQVTVYEVG